MAGKRDNAESAEKPLTSTTPTQDEQSEPTSITSTSKRVGNDEKGLPGDLGDYSVEELEQGLDIISLGTYNLKYAMLISLLLMSSVMEIVGNAIVLPSAKCDLGISDPMRVLITAIPYAGIILTSYFHGYLIDTRGRKTMAVYTSLAAGVTSFLTAFMPNLALFVVFKILTSLCIAVPSALPYTFIGEIVPKRHRDKLLAVTNAIQLVGSALDPLIAWIFIPLQFTTSFGTYMFRPWRLLIMIYSSFLIIFAGLLTFGPESPKFLLSRGKPEAALKVLQIMYAGNKRKSPEEFPNPIKVHHFARKKALYDLRDGFKRRLTCLWQVKVLHAPPLSEPINVIQCMKRQTTPLLKTKYLKYILLNGCLLFGVLGIFNGVYMWIIDAMNKVLSYEHNDLTACDIIMATSQFDKEDEVCDDAIDTTAIMINAMTQVICAGIGIGVSFAVDYIGKIYVLISCFLLTGSCCLFFNNSTSSTLILITMSICPIISLAIGPIHAFCMEIFPIHMRGMAVLLCMMLGRIGSIVGTTFTGFLMEGSCHIIFHMCAAFLFACAFLSVLLPGQNKWRCRHPSEYIN